jgi:AraC family transcriptional activator of pobA
MAASCDHLPKSNMTAQGASIRTYSLFGESVHFPDVMHCETIAARSALHDWELAPHRHARLHQVLVLESGGGVARVEGETIVLRARSVLNIPAGTVHGFSFRPGSDGYITTLPDDLVDASLEGVGSARRALSKFSVTREDRVLRALVRQIWSEFGSHGAARALVLRGLCATLLGLVARAVASEPAPDGDDAVTPRLFSRFETLLEAHHVEQWKVARYAEALGVSPTHLSRVSRAITGLPASGVVDQRLMREARRLLAYTAMSITTIAYALGFDDPAHFSRSFNRLFGCSPRTFRHRLHAA